MLDIAESAWGDLEHFDDAERLRPRLRSATPERDASAPGYQIWSEANTDILKELWGKASASEISRLIPGATRNSVIGKAHRLGLASPPRREPKKPAYEERRRAMRAQARVARAQEPGFEPQRTVEPRVKPIPVVKTKRPPPMEPDPANNVTFIELDGKMCAWPLGDPRSPDFRFCGHSPRVTKHNGADSCYCAYHFAMAYEPIDRRRQSSNERFYVRSI